MFVPAQRLFLLLSAAPTPGARDAGGNQFDHTGPSALWPQNYYLHIDAATGRSRRLLLVVYRRDQTCWADSRNSLADHWLQVYARAQKERDAARACWRFPTSAKSTASCDNCALKQVIERQVLKSTIMIIKDPDGNSSPSQRNQIRAGAK
jgi:hypothetical protein